MDASTDRPPSPTNPPATAALPLSPTSTSSGEDVSPTRKKKEKQAEEGSNPARHHHLPRMLLHRNKSKRARVAVLPVSGSPSCASASASASGTPLPGGGVGGGVDGMGQAETPKVAGTGAGQSTTFMVQVLDWIRGEKQRQRDRAARREAKRADKKTRRKAGGQGQLQQQQEQQQQVPQPTDVGIPIPSRKDVGVADVVGGNENRKLIARSAADDGTTTGTSPVSTSSNSTGIGASTASLDQLERIVQANLAASTSSLRLNGAAGTPPRHHSHHRKSRRPHSRPVTSHGSDTEATPEGDVLIPECEVTLEIPEEIGWDAFKSEVLKLAHTLRCKGWRRIALERYQEVEVSRISGALTNAVYMVVPPHVDGVAAPTTTSTSTKTPSKLLLRVYGAQVSHLIDRTTELSILRRLARKKIGPRLLGTFENGRFEEFLNADTLTKDDIRHPETSTQIAKRMRELHEGVDLEKSEIRAGPVVWLNWEKWVGRARGIMEAVEGRMEKRKGKGGVVAWKVFEEAVGRYRKWLVERYGGEEEIRNELVFAHNDTQYGNILRVKPQGDSPLLLAMNTHRQLIVIDFEYASANPPGFEVANHFCEWMANYHAPTNPHILHESRFPTPSEQRNFLRAYVGHSSHPLSSSPSTPAQTPTPSQFMLDSSAPSGCLTGGSDASYKEEEAKRQEELEREVERLREEARAWRPASHAMWAAWGVVQAKMPVEAEAEDAGDDGGAKDTDGEEEGKGEFDYLGYVQQRALLFWGDMIALGVMSVEEVEKAFEGVEEGVARAKRVE